MNFHALGRFKVRFEAMDELFHEIVTTRTCNLAKFILHQRQETTTLLADSSTTSVHARRMRYKILLLVVTVSVPGCGWLPVVETEPFMMEPLEAALPNPISIQVESREFTWNAIIDTVDDYFEIAEEQRVQNVGGVLTEGQILTHWRPGSGIQEIWNKDSTPGFEKWHSTFQSIRRRADITVTPSPVGYDVQVVVYKQLEDLDHPERSSVGRTLQRHDGGIVRQPNRAKAGPAHLGWIPLGRDVSLEQTILADIKGRFTSLITPTDIQLLPPTIPPVDLRR